VLRHPVVALISAVLGAYVAVLVLVWIAAHR
jgi:hypothetical protein